MATNVDLNKVAKDVAQAHVLINEFKKQAEEIESYLCNGAETYGVELEEKADAALIVLQHIYEAIMAEQVTNEMNKL